MYPTSSPRRRLPLLALLASALLAPLVSAPPPPASAQGVGATPTATSIVDAAIGVDHPSRCDEIAWAVLPDELAQNTVDLDRQGACHFGVGAFFIGGCLEPFTAVDVPEEGIPTGKAHVFCTVGIKAVEDRAVSVDPADFEIVDARDRRYPADAALLAGVTAERRLPVAEVAPMDGIGGRVAFVVDAPLETPFLLAWRPADPPRQRAAVIVVDRLEPW